MAPGGGGKRKRGDRTFSHDSREEPSRPSPHRPGSLNLAQQGHSPQGLQQASFNRDQHDQRGGGRRRGSRGGRGGGSQRSPINSPNAIPLQSRPVNGVPKTIASPSVPATSQILATASQISQSQPAPPPSTVTIQTPESKSIAVAPYNYVYITDERLRTWTASGRKFTIDAGMEASRTGDPLALGLVFQEVIRSGVDMRLDPTDAGSVIRAILEQHADNKSLSNSVIYRTPLDASSLFLDCLSVFTELVGAHARIQPLVLATGISPLLMRCELDSTLLESLGMIRNTFVRVGIRQQTNLLYRQSNYNLLREESEGYSKLVTDLFTTSSSEPLTSEVIEETFERVKGMIGAFDLDVGRVLDVTLDVFAAVLVKQYRFFVKYLRVSSWWPPEKTFSGVPLGQTSSTLPKWALPGSSGRPISDEEREDLVAARDERDKLFWQRTKEIGMGAFFEIGGRRADNAALETAVSGGSIPESAQLDEDRKWIDATGTLPPPGNKVAAQVLGFKLRFYSSSARDPTDVLPVNLIYLAALLIKVGFISLRDLYPHLWPADEDMELVKEEKMKEKAEREKLNRPGGGTVNALMAAGALVDDTPEGRKREADMKRETDRLRTLEAARNAVKTDSPTENTPGPVSTEEKDELPEPSDQKVQLLKSLLCIGAIPESLYMLGRFPWLPDAFPELPEHIHRILHHCLNKLYEPLRPLKDRTDLREQQKIPDPDQTGAIKGQPKLLDAPPRKTMRWAQLDKDDTNEAIDYRFYWDDWADSVPVCQSIDDVFLLCSTLLNFTGVKIGQDTSLLLKLSRIGSHSLATDPSENNVARWIDLSKRLLVPALSLTKSNPGVVNEVFELIKNFSTTVRYGIYAEWYSGQTSRLPDIKAAFEQSKAETRDVLKRISKTSVKPMARALAKVAYASPGIVFQVAISQIEVYDNLVETVVECARYFTYLGYDVLTWSLMSSLGGHGRTRVQADGMLTSRWLAALSLFAGRVFKRYSVMSPTPILQYVAEQLRMGNSTDLIVLEEIVNSMAGIVSDTNFNETQVLSMAGGELLQAQTMLQLLDRRHESKNTARRLIKSLTETRLAGQVLISIAHERQTCIYKIPDDAPLKLLGNLFDELHRILIQYLDLLRSNLSIKEFDSLVPGVSKLINDFGIEPSVSFWISRPSIASAMLEYDAKNPKQGLEQKKSSPKEPDDVMNEKLGDGSSSVEATITEDSESLAEKLNGASPLLVNGVSDTEKLDAVMKGEEPAFQMPLAQTKTQKYLDDQPWHPVLREVMESIRPALPEKTWEIMGQPFYVTFWQLSLRDLLVPTQSYEDEINRQKKKILNVNSDRSDISILGTQKKEREKKSLNDLQDRLRAELKDQVSTYSITRTRLQKEKEYWFSGLWGKWDALNIALIEQCFFPRILISPVDAMYVFKMLKFLHSSGATNFRTMGVLDQLFKEKRLTSMLFLCTAKEAENFGRFLNEVLRDLSRWHTDKAVFEKEAFGTKKDLPGFCKKMTNEKTILSFWDYEEFRRVLLKWHRNLNSALKACISSGEYMHMRNAINILKAVYQHFPAVNWMGQSQVTSITELSRSETREDLKIAATSLLGNLKRREKDWVLPQAFNLSESGSSSTNGHRTGYAKPTTPQPDVDPSNTLNPKATDFQPSPRPSINVGLKPSRTASGKLEVEDGEIEDAKMIDTAIKGTAAIIIPQAPQLDANNANDPATALGPPVAEISAGIAMHQTSVSQMPSQVPVRHEEPQETIVQPRMQDPETTRIPYTSLGRSSVPARPEVSRSVPESTHGRLQHTLPNRPEGPPQRPTEHRMPERPTDRGPRENPRDSRFTDRSRTERPGDSLRDRMPERHVSGPQPRSYERPSERPGVGDWDRIDVGWKGEKSLPGRPGFEDNRSTPPARDTRPLPREERIERSQRDRPFPDQHQSTRNPDPQAKPPRDAAMAPPRSNTSQHPDRAALIHGNQDPDRSPFNSHHSDRRLEPSRYENYPNSERSSRGPSPTRNDDRRQPHHMSHHDERPSVDGRRAADDLNHGHMSRYEASHLPTGPRTDRQSVSSSTDRFRESIKPGPTAAPVLDHSRGRLGQESSQNSRQSEQYGRLNPGPDIPIPSGPRMSNGTHPPPNQTGRNVSAPQPQINIQQAQSSSQNPTAPATGPDMPAPTGPSGIRGGPMRVSAPFSRSEHATLSAPSTPVTEAPDTAGIHPDRLKALQGHGVNGAPNTPSNNANTVRDHKENLPPVAIPAPVGPRGSGNHTLNPMAPSPTSRGPPTGPSFTNDRNRGDKRFAGLQNVLQQGGTPIGPDRSGQGASIRGRGGRANNSVLASPSSNSGPSTPSVATMEPFPTTRADLFTGRSSGPPTPQHAEEDLAYGRGGRRESGRENARGGERRSERHHSSRSHSRDKPVGPPMPNRDEERPPRREEMRERPRGGEAANERDLRRSGREDQNRDRRIEPDRRDMESWAGGDKRGGPERRNDPDRRDSGGSGRKRGRGGEDGPMERPHVESKRPRRTQQQ